MNGNAPASVTWDQTIASLGGMATKVGVLVGVPDDDITTAVKEPARITSPRPCDATGDLESMSMLVVIDRTTSLSTDLHRQITSSFESQGFEIVRDIAGATEFGSETWNYSISSPDEYLIFMIVMPLRISIEVRSPCAKIVRES